jgi:IclR family acetate operon transcriptional repressor
MPVKQVQSASRVLTTFEAIVALQPVGVGALARALGDDKSAVQRALITLAEAGWIRRAGMDQARWVATNRIGALARQAELSSDPLPERARPVLMQLRDETGETAILNVIDDGRLVVVSVYESRHVVRAAPSIGRELPALTTAAGQAVLSELDADGVSQLLGRRPTGAELRRLRDVKKRGWSVNNGDSSPGACGLGAAVVDAGGAPVGALTITGPAERLVDRLEALGPTLVAAAAELSGR